MKKLAFTIGLLVVLGCASLSSFAFSNSDVTGSASVSSDKKKCTITATCNSLCYNYKGSYWMSTDFRNSSHQAGAGTYNTKSGTYGILSSRTQSLSFTKKKSELSTYNKYAFWTGIVKDSNGSYLCGNYKEYSINW